LDKILSIYDGALPIAIIRPR